MPYIRICTTTERVCYIDCPYGVATVSSVDSAIKANLFVGTPFGSTLNEHAQYEDGRVIRYLNAQKVPQVKSTYKNTTILSESLIGCKKALHYFGTSKNAQFTFDGVRLCSGERFRYIITDNHYVTHAIAVNLYATVIAADGTVTPNKLLRDAYGNGSWDLTVPEGYTYIEPYVMVYPNGATLFEGNAFLLTMDDIYIMNAITRNVNVWMPNNIYALEGTELQVFKCSVAAIRNPDNYDLHITGNGTLGVNRNAYYSYDVDVNNPDFELLFGLKDEFGTYNCAHTTKFVHVKKGQSPSTNKNVLVIGDSFTDQEYWVAELRRLLTGQTTDTYSG